MILAMFTSTVMGTVVTQDVEIRGEIFTENATYDYTNGAFFWYDLDENLTSEVMTVNITGRDINEGDLVYTCKPENMSYENPDLNTKYGGYMLLGFMAEKYICYDNRSDQLVKLLIEWDSGDKILTMSDPMELPEGYMLSAQEIDLQGDRVWLKLYKDGECVDDSIVVGGDTYVYEDEDDVLLFSCKIDSVFRGTESNMVVVKYVFMRSDTILDIDGGDTFGVMEVKSTSGSIVLKNDETITLDSDSEVEIFDGLYFKVADSTSLRYYLAKTISLNCDPCPECPVIDPCPDQTPCPPCINATPEVVIEYVNVTAPTEPVKNDMPGFESVLALIGLIVVAWIVLHQRK